MGTGITEVRKVSSDCPSQNMCTNGWDLGTHILTQVYFCYMTFPGELIINVYSAQTEHHKHNNTTNDSADIQFSEQMSSFILIGTCVRH